MQCCGQVFTSKSLSSAQTHYSSIDREALGILHLDMITDHKPLVAIFKKDVTSLSIRLQRTLLLAT